MKEKVKIFALGGQAESGKAMYVLEVNDDIYVVEAGFKYPDHDILGVDIIIPDFSYLVENKKRVKAIFISHGHDNVLAALPYLLREINVPIFAASLTADIIEHHIQRYNKNVKSSHHRVKPQLIRIRRNGTAYVENMNVWFFAMTHAMPGNVGVAFDTKSGFVVFAGEFIIDFGAIENFQSDLLRMTEIGKKGVLCLLGESYGAIESGYTAPKHRISDKIEPTFEEASGRIIVAMNEQNIFGLHEIVELVIKYNRRVIFYNRTDPEQNDLILGDKNTHKHPIVYVPYRNRATVNDITKARNSDLVIVMLGTVKSLFTDIIDVVNGADDKLTLNSHDTFIMAAGITPVSEIGYTNAQNELFKSDANLVMLKAKAISQMHASCEDLKMLFKVFDPKYYIPIKGEYNELIANKNIALSVGMDQANVPIIDNGEILTFVDGELLPSIKTIDVDSIMIDGIGVGDVGSKVIDDRVMLSGNGVVIAGIAINLRKKEVIATPDIQTRGFVYLKDAKDIIEECGRRYEELVQKRMNSLEFDVQDVRAEARDVIYKYLYKETGKKPVVLTVIVEV